MKQSLLAVAVATLALGACKREAAPAPATPAVVAPAETADPATATDATAVVQHGSQAGDVPSFDTKGFAGRFGAAGSRLEIAADGAYRLSLPAQGTSAAIESQGTWTVEANGKEILLDPNSKAEADRRYEIVTHDELRALDGSQGLRREPGGG